MGQQFFRRTVAMDVVPVPENLFGPGLSEMLGQRELPGRFGRGAPRVPHGSGQTLGIRGAKQVRRIGRNAPELQ